MSEAHNTSIVLSSGSEKDHVPESPDSDSTDYEPEAKKCKIEDQNTQAPGNDSGNKLENDDGSQALVDEIGPTDSENEEIVLSAQGQADCLADKPAEEVVEELCNNNDIPTPRPPTPEVRGERVRRRRRRRRRSRLSLQIAQFPGSDTESSGSLFFPATPPTRSFGSGRKSPGYITEDIDPMEIPSDEYLSPPIPTVRPRRNAIFERRDPPPSEALENEDDRFFQNEFEVASVSDVNDNPIEDANSTSGMSGAGLGEISPLQLQRRLSDPVTRADTDNNFADNETLKTDSDSDSSHVSNSNKSLKGMNSTDSEISEKDKWFCSQCNAKSMPYFRYCLRCFKIRRNWLPKRPQSRRLKKRKAEAQRDVLNTSGTTKSSCSSGGEDVVDGFEPPSSLPKSPLPSTSSDGTPRPSLEQKKDDVVQPNLPTTPAVDMNDAFMIDQNHPALTRIIETSKPGNVTLLELFTPPDSRAANCVNDISSNSQATTELGSSLAASPFAQPNSQTLSASSQSQSHSSQSQGSSIISFNSQNSSGTSATQSSVHSSQQNSSDFESQEFAKPTGKKEIDLHSLCTICCVRSKDAAFVHNKIAHHYCCYSCADKILKKDGKCPICRDRVLRVVKIISV